MTNDAGAPANGSAGSSLQAPPAGLEPATCGLEVRCSVHLSYGGSAASLYPRRPGLSKPQQALIRCDKQAETRIRGREKKEAAAEPPAASPSLSFARYL